MSYTCSKFNQWNEFKVFTLSHLNEINELIKKHENSVQITNFLKKIRETCLTNIEEVNDDKCFTCGLHYIQHQ